MNQEPRRLLQSSALASSLLLLLACSSGPQPGPQAETTAKAVDFYQRAEIRYSEGKAEEALSLLDQAFEIVEGLSREQLGKLHLLAGEANLKFAVEAQQQRRGAVVIESSYIDSEKNLKDAARLMPDDARPWAFLAQVRFKTGRWDEMRQAAEKAGELISSRGEELEPDQVELLARVIGYEGYAYLRECTTERQAELADDPKSKVGEKTYAYASQALTRFKRSIELDPEQVLSYYWMANCEEWINRPLDAIAILRLSIQNNPANDAHHRRLQSLYLRYGRLSELVSVYKKLSAASTTAKDYYEYYLGIAWQMKADAARKRGDNETAVESYEGAQIALENAARNNPSFKSNCDLTRAICEFSKAAMSLEDGEEGRAWDELTSAWNLSHRIVERDERGLDRYVDSFRKSYRILCYKLGQRYMEGRLAEAVVFWRKLTARHPTWGPAWNNLGFALRDHGSRLARKGDREAAMAEWEESWKAYGQARRYSPKDERIVNDSGLMLVYHLNRDYEKAEKLFRKAIEMGQAKLDEMEEDDVDIEDNVRTARRDVEEAVGDAYQNLGVLYKKLEKPAESRKAYKNAVRYWSPSLRIQIRTMLRRSRTDDTREWVAAISIPPVLVPPRWHTSEGIFEDEHSRIEHRGIEHSRIEHRGMEPTRADNIKKILALLTKGKAEDALDLCERVLDDDPENVELLYLAGRGSLLFARQAMRARRSGAQTNLIDAATRFSAADQATRKLEKGSPHFGTAIHILPVLYLMETRIAQGKALAGMDAGKTHRTHLMGVSLDFDPALMARFRATLGEATLRAATRLQGDKRSGMLEDAKRYMMEAHKGLEKLAKKSSLSGSEKEGALLATIQKGAGKDWDPQKLYQIWKDIELWRGKPAAAVIALGKGAELLGGAPRLALANTLVEMVAKRGEAKTALRILDRLVEGSKGDATLLWYRGRAHFLLALELRRAQKQEDALPEIRLSRADFEKSVAKNAAFKSSTAIWLAYTWLAEAALDFAREDWDATGKALVKSLAATPAAADAMDHSGWSTRKYIKALGGRYYKKGRFAEAIAFFDAVLEHLGGDPEILSNKGLMLRDWGNIVSRRDKEKGRKLFEKSYAAYKLALKLARNDVRTMNDAALIDVFYLHSEPDATRSLLERAIETGARLLVTERRKPGFDAPFVEEATGDACMNLGKLLLEHFEDLDGAKRVLKKGLGYKRPSQRDIDRLLRRVEAKRKEGNKK